MVFNHRGPKHCCAQCDLKVHVFILWSEEFQTGESFTNRASNTAATVSAAGVRH